jgi:H+/Cl- antiporter ClcA
MKCYRQFIEKVGMDKVAHFFGVAFVCFVISIVFYKVEEEDSSWIYAFEGLIAGVITAVAKEVFDFFDGGKFDLQDILAGLVGAVLTFLLVGIFL